MGIGTSSSCLAEPSARSYEAALAARTQDDRFRRSTLEPMATARWNGEVIAQSDDTKVVEGNEYFPPDSVRADFLAPSETRSTCPWKGEASYYTLRVNGDENPDAAWYYPTPKDAAAEIKDHVAFWRGVEVTA
jgi:uncharacterized protein (DUF427 family)